YLLLHPYTLLGAFADAAPDRLEERKSLWTGNINLAGVVLAVGVRIAVVYKETVGKKGNQWLFLPGVFAGRFHEVHFQLPVVQLQGPFRAQVVGSHLKAHAPDVSVFNFHIE